MGGSGSGNRCQIGKRTTSDMWRLDVRRLHRDGLLTPGMGFGWMWSRNGKKVAEIGIYVHEQRVILKYRTRPSGCAEWEDKEYPVALEWTACRFGGQRVWFLCPICGRRVAVLFGGSVYACRHCHNLAYEVQREQPHYRLLRRSQKMRDMLGGDSWHIKPKGMHQRTYDRLVDEYFAIDAAMEDAICKKFGFSL